MEGEENLPPQVPTVTEVTRESNGRWERGTASPNPQGKNGGAKGYMRIDIRLQKWMEKSAREIADLYVSDELKDISAMDVGCIRAGYFMMTEQDPAEFVKVFKEVNDRIGGKAIQTVRVTDADEIMPEDIAALTDEQVAEAFRSLRNK